jgi:hypothetical protein
MSSPGVLAFALAMLLVLASTRWSPLLLLGLTAVFVLVPHDIYHDEWALHGPLGAFDVTDLFTLMLLVLSAAGTWGGKVRPERRRVLRITAGVAGGSLVLAVMGLALGNQLKLVLNDSRALLCCVGTVWYALLRFDIRDVRRLVWCMLVLGVVGIIVNGNAFLEAARAGQRADTKLWVTTCLPVVLFGGWALSMVLVPKVSWRGLVAWAALMAFYVSAIAISQTRGYAAGTITGIAVAVFFAGRRGVAAALVVASLIGLLVVKGSTGPIAPEPGLGQAFDKAGERVRWDDSVEDRGREIVELAEQNGLPQWVLGRGIGGTYDASRVHPGEEWALEMSYTHSGLFNPLLRFGVAGMVVALWLSWTFGRRVLRVALRRKSPFAMGVGAAFAAYLVANVGDPIIVQIQAAILFALLIAGGVLVSLPPANEAAPSRAAARPGRRRGLLEGRPAALVQKSAS